MLRLEGSTEKGYRMAQTRRRAGEPVQTFDPLALRRLRQVSGLTLDAVGERARVSRSSLIAYERGSRRPGLETMSSLAVALGVKPMQLTRGAQGDPALRDLRVAAGLTKTELAGRLGMARSNWDLIERGRRELRSERMAALAQCLGVDQEVVVAAARATASAPPPNRENGLAPEGASEFACSAAPGRIDLQLPIDAFIGRGGQVIELAELLARSRLVTLTGSAGIGKTRLAMELGRRCAGHYADGAWLVELASTRDPALVPQALASALGVREQPGSSLTNTLCLRLRHAAMLLVIDNCEHLKDASAQLLAALLEACPSVSFLATSQQSLGVDGELVWAVPPLEVPSGDLSGEEAAASESVRLFAERAAAVHRGFRLTPEVASDVSDVCRELAGIPLAIELAAARTSVLTPAEIAERLNDPLALLRGGRAAGRHRTLRDALDWSYGLLPPVERTLLRRLSVFAGGCGIDAVAAVCGQDPGGDAGVLDSLAALVAKSLVTADTSGRRARYRLLESVRLYAADHAAEAGETGSLRAAHLGWFVALAEGAEVALTGPDQVGWLERLETEHDNLRSALSWAISTGDADSALRLSGALTLFWRVRGYFREGRSWLESALSLDEQAPPVLLAKALRGRGFLAFMRHDTNSAMPALELALELSRSAGDVQGEARSLLLLGNAQAMKDASAPAALFEQSIAMARRVDDGWCLGHALAMLARGRMQQGDVDTARRLLEECVRGARESGELQSLRIGLYLLGHLAMLAGDYLAAEALLGEGLEVTRHLGEPFDQAAALQALGQVAMARGELGLARTQLQEALQLSRQTCDPRSICRALCSLGTVALREAQLDTADGFFEAAAALAAKAQLSHPPAQLGLGEVIAAKGDTIRARTQLEKALELALAQGDGAVTARAWTALAELRRGAGDLRRAFEHNREALRLRSGLGDRMRAAESLQAMAGLEAEAGHCGDAARLLGAAHHLREQSTGAIRGPLEKASEVIRDRVRAALGPQAFASAWESGLAMPSLEAIARMGGGGRDQPRPVMGWVSLTGSERRIATLVVEGLTNAQIAKRLFITISTVEGHVTNVFGKLGVVSRAQLVRAWMEQGAAETR